MSSRLLIFFSTFAVFFSRAVDQIRMAAISFSNLKCVGSHAGVSIGEDGPSQMGLEDLALFRSSFLILSFIIIFKWHCPFSDSLDYIARIE